MIATNARRPGNEASEYWITRNILIAFLHFFSIFRKKDPAGSMKHKINLVWPNGLALSPGHSQILSHSCGENSGCEIKSGSGLGTRLVMGINATLHGI